MNVQKHEIPHYTREQVEEHVRVALEIVEALELSPALAIAILPSILDKLAAKQVVIEQMQMPPGLLGPSGLG